jgi:hypothetical protein
VSELESKLALEADLPAVVEAAVEAGASIEKDANEDLVYWLTMSPSAAPEETFNARIGWTAYPQRPPSVKFAERIAGPLDVVSAWPVIPGYRPEALDICQPFTAEGFGVHPEWESAAEAWQESGNPFLAVVTRLLHDITDRYQRRAP